MRCRVPDHEPLTFELPAPAGSAPDIVATTARTAVHTKNTFDLPCDIVTPPICCAHAIEIAWLNGLQRPYSSRTAWRASDIPDRANLIWFATLRAQPCSRT